MIKEGFFGVFFVVFLLLFSSSVSANFVCGKVNAPAGYSSGWVNVIINYVENPSKTTSCQVSPENSKFCCDPTEISAVTWAAGKNVTAVINDNVSGFFAFGVNITISGNGYDVFPEMQLLKGVNIDFPSKSIFSNQNKIDFEASSSLVGSNISYVLHTLGGDLNQSLCNGCNSVNFSIYNLSEGRYDLDVFATDGKWGFKDRKTFFIVNNFSYERKITCEGCKGNVVPSSAEIVNISVSANFSVPISGGKFKDFFPSNWQFLSGGDFQYYSGTQSSVSWEVNGSSFKGSYLLVPPKVFFGRRYTFATALEDLAGRDDYVYLSRFPRLWFFSIPSFFSYDTSEIESVKYLDTPEGVTLYLGINNSIVNSVQIFTNSTSNVKTVEFSRNTLLEMTDAEYYFVIGSDIKNEFIQQVQIGLSIPKPKSLEITNISLYYRDGLSWKEVNDLTFESDDGNNLIYRAITGYPGTFAVKKSYKVVA